MPAAPISPNEASRLKALRSLNLLDSAPEAEYDDIVELGRAMFDVPICLISLIDEDRQWFKAGLGFDTKETPRSVSFCSHAILSRSVLVVPDATQDARFSDNPLVNGPPFIRFYAGAPLWLPTGHPIGTLCVMAPEPRQGFDAAAIRKLEMLAGTVMTTIAARVLRGVLETIRAQAGSPRASMRAVPFPVAVVNSDGRLAEWNTPFARLCKTADLGNSDIANAVKDLDGWNLGRVRRATAGGKKFAMRGAGVELSVYPRSGGFLIVGE